MKSKIYINGKLLGDVEVEGLDLQSSKPSSDFKKGPFTATVEVKLQEPTEEMKKIIKELKQQAEMEEKLEKLLKELSEITPTLMVIGLTKEKQGVLFMGSPEQDGMERGNAVAANVATMMAMRKDAHDVILAAVCYHLQQSPEDQVKMYEALNMMKQPTAKS